MQQLQLPKIGEKIYIMKTTLGDIYFRLFEDKAKKSCENFIKLSESGYYDNVKFHRVIKDFMIQSGDPTATGMGGESIWKSPFEDEFNFDLRHFRGALSMANAGPNTNGSQFFIVQNSNISKEYINYLKNSKDDLYTDEIIDLYEKNGGAFWLDYKHSVFGQVFKGMDIVDKIASVNCSNDRPIDDIVIIKIISEKFEG